MEQQDRRDMSMREMQNQRGGKPQQQQQQPPPPPPQQPQKCPRCDSLNTKFCYYNNYSLSQPRYFCKTCRRYWTQGGTLRNVPVGGGCRKGKRLKRSSSSLSPDNNINLNTSASRSKTVDSLPSSITSPLVPIATGMNLQQQQHQHQHQQPLFYPGGGFLSSLAAFQSFNHQQQNQTPGAEFGSPGLSLLQGFNFQQMHHFQQQQNLFHQTHDLNIGTSSDGVEEKVVPSTSHHQEWSQGFNIPNSESTVGGGGYWTNTSMSTTSTVTEPTVGIPIPIPLNTPHWTDHLGSYGGPSQPPSSAAAPTSSSPPSFLLLC